MRDMLEIVRAEKKGVKLASKLALFVQKMTGAADPEQILNFGRKSDDTNTRHTEEIDDGVIKYMFPGEKVESPMSGRPSAAWQGFMEFLVRDMAISFDLPYAFVWSMAGLPGPAVRMESKQAERTFSEWIDEAESQMIDPTVSWVINDAMEQKRLAFNPFWMKFQVCRPAHVSIDVGRESDKDLKEHERGFITAGEIIEARGGNEERTMRRRARSWKRAAEIAEQEGVPFGAIMQIPGVSDVVPPEEASDLDNSDDDDEVDEENEEEIEGDEEEEVIDDEKEELEKVKK